MACGFFTEEKTENEDFDYCKKDSSWRYAEKYFLYASGMKVNRKLRFIVKPGNALKGEEAYVDKGRTVTYEEYVF